MMGATVNHYDGHSIEIKQPKMATAVKYRNQ